MRVEDLLILAHHFSNDRKLIARGIFGILRRREAAEFEQRFGLIGRRLDPTLKAYGWKLHNVTRYLAGRYV